MEQHHAPQQGKTSGRWVQCSGVGAWGSRLEWPSAWTDRQSPLWARVQHPSAIPTSLSSLPRPDWLCPPLCPSVSQPPVDQLEPRNLTLPTNPPYFQPPPNCMAQAQTDSPHQSNLCSVRD
ncbi:hypothetical protein Q8A67_019377 [Cirrhinus molitorella]|uniref:Uncharacterized protein n=1 Tax=Cirrhinus molitorella TaxID=172907 RepID=A0AA88PCA0_9TELE|nr:hypothetical protein Q8A67_019377 [Cirrhinus molitorella]